MATPAPAVVQNGPAYNGPKVGTVDPAGISGAGDATLANENNARANGVVPASVTPTPVATPAVLPAGTDMGTSGAPGTATPVTEPTAGQVYGTTGNADLDAAEAAQAAAAKEAADAPDPNDPVVQAQIRATTLASFQQEIDDTNASYARELSTAAQNGQAKIGTNLAQEARSGEIGSTFGAASENNVVSANAADESTITDQQNTAIDAILDKSNAAATAAITAAQTAKTNGLDAYVTYLQGAQTRNAANATAAATAALQAGVDPTTMTPAQMQQYLQNYGISQADFDKAYTTAQAAAKAAQVASEKSVAPGDQIVDNTGKVIYTAPDKAATPPTSVTEYEYAVANSAYKGSYTDFLKMQANLKTPSDQAAADKAASVAAQAQVADSTKASILNKIKTSGGPNGGARTDQYLSPSEWAAYKAAWVESLGTGSAADFDAEFGGYKNPDPTQKYD